MEYPEYAVSEGTSGTENVVIVPESILQAIKSTSSSDKDGSQFVLTPDYRIRLLDPSESDSEANSSNALGTWLSVPVDALGQDVALLDGQGSSNSNKMVNVLIPPEFAHAVEATDVVTATEEQTDLSVGDVEAEIPMLQNICFLPSNGASFPGLSLTQNTNNTPYVTMRIENIESDGENSIYTFAPVGNYDQINAKLIDTTPKEKSSGDDQTATINSESKLTSDKATHTKGPKTTHCCAYPLCNRSFATAARLNEHKVTVHEEKKLYKCQFAGCPWSFPTPYKLKRHLESHTKAKRFACTFAGCTRTFSNSYNLATHAKVHSDLQLNLLCQHCGLVAWGKRQLDLHIRREHNKEPTHLCTVCRQKFHTMQSLVIHRRTHDPEKPGHKCPICGQKFVKRCELKMHLYKHTGERPFQCEQCEWTFTTMSRLNRHMRTHKAKRYTCTVQNCGRQFHRRDQLATHMKIHVGSNDKGEHLRELCSAVTGKGMEFFTCSRCGFNFLSKHGLERHKLKCPKGKNNNIDAGLSNDLTEKNTTDSDSQIKKTTNSNNTYAVEVILDSSSQSYPASEMTSVDNEVEIASHETSELPDLAIPSSSIVQPTSGIEGLESSWSASLLSSDNAPLDTSEYLSQGQVSGVPLAPFIDDMVVLTDSNTHQFLQLGNDIGICGGSTTTGRGSDITENPNADVLCQYVVDVTRLGELPDQAEASENKQFSHNKTSANRESGNLFAVPTIGEPHSITSGTHFSGTTINLNDLQ